MIFRSKKDKRRDAYVKVLHESWLNLDDEDKEKFRKEFFTLYLPVKYITEWQG
jgi:hypothetical protein